MFRHRIHHPHYHVVNSWSSARSLGRPSDPRRFLLSQPYILDGESTHWALQGLYVSAACKALGPVSSLPSLSSYRCCYRGFLREVLARSGGEDCWGSHTPGASSGLSPRGAIRPTASVREGEPRVRLHGLAVLVRAGSVARDSNECSGCVGMNRGCQRERLIAFPLRHGGKSSARSFPSIFTQIKS